MTYAPNQYYTSNMNGRQGKTGQFELIWEIPVKHQLQQKGFLVFINGEVTGFDIISLESAHEKLYPKLLRSYVMDAITKTKIDNGKPSLKKAESFVEEIVKCEEKKYQSVGQGWDCRYSSKIVIGSALVFQKKVIHTAFFKVTNAHSRIFYRDFMF